VMGRAASRIDRALDIGRVRSHGRRLMGKRLTAHVLAAPGTTRVAFVSSRSVGGAVARNRARRLMREAWRQLRPRAAEGHWIVFGARPEMVGAGLDDVVHEVETLLIAGRVIT
jgi:ribonuclease P protein component